MYEGDNNQFTTYNIINKTFIIVIDNTRIRNPHLVVENGNEGTFSCSSSALNGQKGKGETMWYHTVNRELPYQVLTMNLHKELHFEAVQQKQSGYYYCFGYMYGTQQYFWSLAELFVYG